ncbi:hypothetical protein [Actinotalea fermentans]|uniref:Uncharacterized protein n=1 Tax=Actinotalea fermentans TaxID=43671 RepID=A0A511YZ73_9CELL|nr:hypothetical protein [Actinotalea fermentans]KGM15148.1 hypothetical protein N867_11650 [Actinotalea fermentans ATCC 43279 = JCM 9966 = DSM 3133]GEN80500.1 hypothetical protein AFE02nite_22340 [Actinotalea fermentans]
MTDPLEVDFEELRAAARAAFAVADDLSAIGNAEPLAARDAYEWSLAPSTGRFAARFGHFVRELGRNADDAGEVLRIAAEAYLADDIVAPLEFGHLGEGLPSGALV